MLKCLSCNTFLSRFNSLLQCWYCAIYECWESYFFVICFFKIRGRGNANVTGLMWNSDGVSTNRRTSGARPFFKRVNGTRPKFSNTTEGTNQLKTQKYEEDAINYGHAKFSVKKNLHRNKSDAAKPRWAQQFWCRKSEFLCYKILRSGKWSWSSQT